ncbi:MAG: hypothetical protein ACUVRY_03660 [Thermoanaerobaculaceae bacterium]
MRVYLDDNATTATFPEVWERVTVLHQELLGNPSSVHEEGEGREATWSKLGSRWQSL